MAGETFPNLLFALLFQDFPESVVVVLFVFSILNLRLWDRRVVMIAGLQTVTNLVRLLPLAFGMHTVIMVVTLSVYTHLFTGVRLSRILAAVLICVVIVLTAEILYGGLLLNVFNLTYEKAFANPFIRAAFALPYEIILLLAALAKNHYNYRKGLLLSS
jgi:hypothetical protein